MNPFRYRGYYYDVETKLYYLINRYYDPEVGRFISPDHIGYMAEQMEQLNGCNLYAYCGNNPIMGVDPEGTFFWFIAIGALIGSIVNTVAYTVSTAIESVITGENKFTVGGFIGAFVGGAVGGALGATPMAPALSGGIGNAITTFSTMALENAFGEANYSLTEIFTATVIDGLVGAATSFAGSKIKMRGITGGRGSLTQISKQLSRKAFNRTIKRISAKSFGKLMALEAYQSAIGTMVDAATNKSNIKLIYKDIEKLFA